MYIFPVHSMTMTYFVLLVKYQIVVCLLNTFLQKHKSAYRNWLMFPEVGKKKDINIFIRSSIIICSAHLGRTVYLSDHEMRTLLSFEAERYLSV